MEALTQKSTAAKTRTLVSTVLLLASFGIAAGAEPPGPVGAPTDSGSVPWIGIDGRFLYHDELAWLFQRDLGGALLIERVAPGGPAYEAGLRGGFVSALIADQELILGGVLIVALQVPHLCRDQCLLEAQKYFADLDQVGVVFLRDGRLDFALLDLR